MDAIAVRERMFAAADLELASALDALDAAVGAEPAEWQTASERVNRAQEAARVAKADLDAAKTGGGGRTSITEPDMYTRDSGSFLTDLYYSQLKNDPVAAERIGRHQAYEIEKYAVATGTLGGIIPPQYLVDLYAKAQRFGRVFADQCRSEDLPDVGMSVIIP